MKLRSLLLTILLLFVLPLSAQNSYQPAPENLKNREWYQDAKFGMFIHWGVYSVLGDGEWAMQLQKFDKDNYEKLASFFNPVEFDAEEWVEIAKAAGMKYINITSRHHDGFAMFDSKHSTWDIADASPYEKDIIGELAKACHKKGLKLFIYYSHVDWYHNDYYPRGQTGEFSGRPDSGNWKII